MYCLPFNLYLKPPWTLIMFSVYDNLDPLHTILYLFQNTILNLNFDGFNKVRIRLILIDTDPLSSIPTKVYTL